MTHRALGVIAVLALFIGMSNLAKAEDSWVLITNTRTATYSGMAGSFGLTRNKEGDEVASVSGKAVMKKNNYTAFATWYVPTKDCALTQGSVLTVDVDGTYNHRNFYANGDGTAAANIAEVVCGLYKQSEKDTAGTRYNRH